MYPCGVRTSKSRLKASCQLLAFSEFTVFEHRGFLTIDEAVPKELFIELRSDLDRLSLASYFAQAAEVLAQEDSPNPRLLSLLLNCMYALGKLQKPPALVKAVFELRAACLSGYLPDLAACAVCGSPTPDRFNVTHGVLQCAACHSPELGGLHLPLSPGALAAMRYLTQCGDKQLFSVTVAPETAAQLSELTETYLTTQLERGFSTLDFYKSLTAVPAAPAGET